MSTFSILMMLLFIVIFGVQIFLYCVDIDMPKLSSSMTLMLYLMLFAELVLALFEIPAKLIDIIVYISMGYEFVVICSGVIIFIVLTFIFIMIYPKINWQRFLTSSPIKYVITGFLIVLLMVYTEIFNGCYSFSSLDDYFMFKSEFSQYDEHFWPTKYIEDIEDEGKELITTYSVYPWDVNLMSGKQFAYKGVTFYDIDEQDGEYKLFYYPFTYKVYAGVTPVPIDYTPQSKPVSASDISPSDIDE